MTATVQARTESEELSLRIGATQWAIACLLEGLLEDDKTLALFANGTPPEDAGFASEDECAAFIADTERAVTAKYAELQGLRERLAALEAQVPA